jgi:hypothetical protein
MANKKQSKCKKCIANDPARIEKMSAKMSGKNNYFYGKTHSTEVKDKISQKSKETWARKTPEEIRLFGLKTRKAGKDNGMYNKKPYDIWLEKYGKIEADKRQSEMKAKQKKNTPKGKNCYMYGKLPPQGTGNGWKGWYKDFYFRSLRELSYVIYLDENNIKWESAEGKNFTIEYKDYEGKSRTYRPDFIINNTRLVELKPQRLHQSVAVQAKAEAAKKWCLDKNLTYELIDFPVNAVAILEKLNQKIVKFARDYEQRFLGYLSKTETT